MEFMSRLEQEVLRFAEENFQEEENIPHVQQFIIHAPKSLKKQDRNINQGNGSLVNSPSKAKHKKQDMYAVNSINNRPKTRHNPKFLLNPNLQELEEESYRVIPPDLHRIAAKCKSLEQSLMKKASNKFTTNLHDLLISNFQNVFKLAPSQSSDQQQLTIKGKQSKTKKITKTKKSKNFKQRYYCQHEQKKPQKLIIALKVQPNQKNDINFFIKNFVKFMQQYNEPKKGFKPSNMFKHAHRINITYEQNSDMSQIILRLYYHYQSFHAVRMNQVTIHCGTVLTNFSPKHLNKLNEVTSKCNCIIILPTLCTFEHFQNPYQSIQILPIEMYKTKQLFCSFMYECLIEPEIKAYLPKQSLNLIDEFDSFPLSYQEGCRRLIYLIKKFHVICYQKGITIDFCNANELFSVLNKCFSNRFSIFNFSHQDQKFCEAYVRCVLDKDYQFQLTQDLLCLHKFYQTSDNFKEKRNQSEQICKFRQRLHARLGYQTQLKKCQQFLQKDLKKAPNFRQLVRHLPTNKKKSNHKRTPIKKTSRAKCKKNGKKKARSELKLNGVNYDEFSVSDSQSESEPFFQANRQIKSEIELLNFQLTILIKFHTEKIRKYSCVFNQKQLGKSISWEQFKYISTIKPLIPYQIHNSIIKHSHFQKFYEQIFRERIIALNDLEDFIHAQMMEEGNQQDLQLGKIMFRVKQLLAYGLISFENDEKRPLIFSQFHPKTHHFQQADREKRTPLK